jgi:hypothetical protein
MRASTVFGPFSAPHRTKHFWLVVGLLAVVVVCAPQIQALLGLPPFPRSIQISSGLLTLLTMTVAVWFAFRFGRIGWFIVAILMLAFGLWAGYHA